MKETFIMKTNFLTDDDIELFTPEEIGLLTIAWSRFVQTGTQPTRETLPVHLIVKFNQWKEFYQFNEQKYQEKVQRMSEAQKKSKSDRKGALLTETEQIESESESESVFVSDIKEKEETNVSSKEKAAFRFLPPTVDEVREYCQSRHNQVDPETFVNFYQAKNWMIGKNKMKDWKAAVRTWEQHRDNTVLIKGPMKTVEEINLENYRRQYEKEVRRNEQRTDVKLFGIPEPSVLVKAD